MRFKKNRINIKRKDLPWSTLVEIEEELRFKKMEYESSGGGKEIKVHISTVARALKIIKEKLRDG